MDRLKDKQIVIWGYGKQQKDFQYIFEEIVPKYYVAEEAQEGVKKYDCLQKEDRHTTAVIVCRLQKDMPKKCLEDMGFCYGENYFWAEDFFDSLDFDWEQLARGRKIALWGNEEDLEYYESHSDISDRVHLYICENKNQDECFRNGIIVRTPEEITNWEELYVIVADRKNYEDICSKLMSKGRREHEDFASCEKDYLCWDWKKRAAGRKIAVWGTGVAAESWENLSQIGKGIDFYIDSNPEKAGKLHHAKKIVHPSQIVDWKDLYVIVGVENSKHVQEISRELEGFGLQRGRDYDWFMQEAFERVERPSVMMRKTYESSRVRQEICSFPFINIFIENGGYLFPDSQVWHKGMAFGRIGGDECSEIWNSNVAKVFRLSIVNGTYSFCDLDMCERRWLGNSDCIEEQDHLWPEVRRKEVPDLRMNYDVSCNLKCRQCRKEYQTSLHQDEQNVIPTLWRRVEESGWLDKTELLEFAGNGEVFFTDNYKKLLFAPVKNQGKRKEVQIVTNGVLFNGEYWKKVEALYEKISVVVSVDAATEETYQRVRGNTWKALIKNLTMLGELRAQGRISYLSLQYCVQMDNVSEMGQFVKLAESFHADSIGFQRMYKRVYMTQEEYNGWSCFHEDGTPKQELLDAVKEIDFESPLVNRNSWLFRYLKEYI